MIERKAFFISAERLTNIENEKETLVIFDVNHDMVIGVETIYIKDKFVSIEELLLFLQRKYIRVIYVSEMDKKTEELFLKFGIVVKTARMPDNDRLFNSLYLSSQFF